MNLSLPEFIAISSWFFALLAFFLYWLEYRHRLSLEKSTPPKQTPGVLRQAFKKAQAILGRAELEGVKVVADSKFQTRELERKFEEKMDEQGARLAQQMAQLVEKQTTAVIANFDKKLEKTLDDEIIKAQTEIADYKKRQMAKIDGAIVAIVERTVAKVLNKKLGLSQQADLVFEALEKAKAEEFI